MESWDIYDIDRNKKEGQMLRTEPIKAGDYHMGAHVGVFNHMGQMLIQKRQPFKDGYPGRWDLTSGGSSLQGENSRQTAHRELLEEVGIDHDFTDVRPHLTINREGLFDDFYLIEKEVSISDLKLQYEEVEAVKWAALDEIIDMIEKSEFVPYYEELIRLLFAMRKGYGSYGLGR